MPQLQPRETLGCGIFFKHTVQDLSLNEQTSHKIAIVIITSPLQCIHSFLVYKKANLLQLEHIIYLLRHITNGGCPMDYFFPFIHKIKKIENEPEPLYIELYPPPQQQAPDKIQDDENESTIIIIQL